MIQPICHRSTDEPSSPFATNYGGFGCEVAGNAGTFEFQAYVPWNVAGAFRNLIIGIDTAPGSGKSWVGNVRKNGVNTGMTVTIADGAVTGSDFSNDFTVSPGDLLTIQWIPSGTPTAMGSLWYYVEFHSDNAGESGYALQMTPSAATGTHQGVFWAAQSTLNAWSSAAGADVANVISTAGTITSYRLKSSLNVGADWTAHIWRAPAGSSTFTKQDGSGGTANTTCTIPNGASTASASFSLAVSPGDRVYIESTGTNARISLCTRFVASVDGRSMIGGWSANGPQTGGGGVSYRKVDAWANWGQTAESAFHLIGGETDFTLRDFYLSVVTAPGSGKSITFDLRKNSATPAGTLSIVLADSNTTGNDLVNSVAITDVDTFHLRATTSGGPTVSATSWSMVVFAAPAVGNQPPIANAGPDQSISLPTGTFTMAGSGSDDGLPYNTLTYEWELVSGPPGVTIEELLDDPTDPTSLGTADEIGTYVLRLTVSDGVLSDTDEMTLLVEVCKAIEQGPTICGTENVLTWIVKTQTHDAAYPTSVTRVVSDAPLNDPITYYDGKKEPVVNQWGEITRAASDVRGQWQATTMRWRESETERQVRGLYGAPLTHVLTNTSIVAWMIRYSEWVAKSIARLVFIGYLLRATPAEQLTDGTDIEAGDQLARDLEVGGEPVQCPRRLFSTAYTPGIPSDLIGQPEPIIYGKESDELSDNYTPEMTATAPWGGFIDGIAPNFGWAPTGGPAAPTGVSMTELSSGQIDQGDHPSDRFFAIVWHATGGVHGDPDTFDQRTPGGMAEVTLTGNDKRIKVDWTKTGTPDQTYVALGYVSTGRVKYSQVAQVAGSVQTFTFDNAPSIAELTVNDYSQLATGATGALYLNFAYYRVAAKDADGRWTVLSDPAAFTFASGFAETGPYRRPSRLQFQNVDAGTTEIGIWKFMAGSELSLGYFTIPYTGSETYIDDDWLGTNLLDGQPPEEVGKIALEPFYGGTEISTFDGQVYHRWFVASHAVDFMQPYVDGVLVASDQFQWLWPGQPGYSDRFGSDLFRDFNGRRYTVLYGLSVHPDVADVIAGDKVLTANIWGVEPVGDGTGDVIEDLFDQYLHWFINFGPLGDYQSGAWLSSPTWSPVAEHCKINADSWRDARDAAAVDFTGGYTGGGVIAERAAMRDWIARWNLSLDVRLGQNAAGQWTIGRWNPAAAVSTTYTEIQHVQAGSVVPEPLHDEHWNIIPYRYGFNRSSGLWQSGTATSETEIDAESGVERKSPTFDLYFVSSPALAQHLVEDRMLQRHKTLPWRYTFETIDLCGSNSDLFDVVGLTGSWGLDVDGWTSFPLWIERHTIMPGVQRTRLTGRCNVAPHLFGEVT